MARRNWTEKETEKAVAYRKQGLSNNEIAERLDRSYKSVVMLFCRHGIKAPPEFDSERRRRAKSYTFTDEEIEALRTDFEAEKLTINEICEKHHMSTTLLYRLVDDHGFKPREIGLKKSGRKVKIIPFPVLFKMYHDQCMQNKAIAATLKVSDRVVARSIEYHGLDSINRRERLKIRDEFADRESVPKTGGKKK